MRRFLFMVALVIFTFRFETAPAQERPILPEGMFIINEDCSHFFVSRTADQMTLEGLHAFVDQYADTRVTHLFLNSNGSRANFTNPARDAIWAPNCEGNDPDALWPTNCRLLEERGLDPYKIWIERCREKKISPWISMRMNDVHTVDDKTDYKHSSFWWTHPQWWRIPNGDASDWANRALNFRHPEVRKHVTDFIDVLFERYDFDGLELDWMRFGWHLTPGREEEEAHFVTEVVEYARKRADEWSVRRGHPILLAARVSADPDDAARCGMDGVAWAKSGLIDLLIPCPFWFTTDFDIPVERWLDRVAGTGVAVVPGAESHIRAWPGGTQGLCSQAQLYGFAASEKFRGATSVYLFNWMDCFGDPAENERYLVFLKNGFDDEFLATVRREIPLTYHDTVPVGAENGSQLPQETGKPAVFRIPIGPKPTTDSGNGVVIGLSESETLRTASLSATLGGTAALSATDMDPAKLPGATRAVFFPFPKEAFRDGDNEFIVTSTDKGSERIVFVMARIH